MSDLDKLVRDYYGDQSLSDGRITEILNAAQRPPRQATPNRVWYVRLSAVAAALLLGFAVFHTYSHMRVTTQGVLAEIAMNHGKSLAVEFETDAFADLQTALDRLDFVIEPPAHVLSGYQLIGGRYCSIQGGIAAQVKLRDTATGVVDTLYATRLTPALTKVGEQTTRRDNVTITLWRADDVFYGLARSASD